MVAGFEGSVMSRVKDKIKFPVWFMAFCIFLFFLSGCGNGDNSSPGNNTSSPSTETGSIHFNVAWQSTPTSASDSSLHAQSAELDCAGSGVSTVAANVYDESNLLVASGEWNCSAHFGTISNIKVGSNRTLVILAKDSQGDNIFLGGPMAGITILPNQTYNAGIITAIPYSITLVSPVTDSSIVNCNFSFQWFGAVVGKFEIQIDDSIDFSSLIFTQIINGNSYTPANLDPGRYYWRVRTVDGFGNPSKWSETWNFTVANAIGQSPSAPTGVNAVAGDSQIIISWNSVSGATSYNLYWSTSPGVSRVSYTEKIPNVTSPFTHTGRMNGTTYYYVVTGVNNCGESIESSQVATLAGQIPSLPTGVNATAGDGQVSISWNSVSGATSYNLYWSTSPGVNKTTGTKISNVTSPYSYTGRINGTTYYYVVTAQNALGESSESSQVSATPGHPPTAPTGVNATAGDGQVSISWNSVSEATSYNLYWSTSSGVNKTTGTKISNVTSPYTHTGRINGTTYYYVVTAVNSYGESSESSQVSARPKN
jgi:fibronectin type 3 domain-containing protein